MGQQVWLQQVKVQALGPAPAAAVAAYPSVPTLVAWFNLLSVYPHVLHDMTACVVFYNMTASNLFVF
jgi:hypothetical protein